jgi:hypothetical protein
MSRLRVERLSLSLDGYGAERYSSQRRCLGDSAIFV